MSLIQSFYVIDELAYVVQEKVDKAYWKLSFFHSDLGTIGQRLLPLQGGEIEDRKILAGQHFSLCLSGFIVL